MKPFAPWSPRSGWAAPWASVTSHGRRPFSLHRVFTGSRSLAPTNPRNTLTSPGFWWSHNSSSKPTPCRGVGCVLYATLARIRRPATGRLNSGVRRQKSFLQICRSQVLFTGFGWFFLSDRLLARFRFGDIVWHAHTPHALRSPASESALTFVGLPGSRCCHF